MKIMQIVGNRPQFIKLAPVSRELRKRGYQDFIVHTGQHFDANMSDVFFEELGIPKPDENLHVSGGSHAQMTAQMMLALEPVIEKQKPDIVIVYGDTNTTLAAALTAKKMCIPVAHVEAGVRSGKEYNPEEINRQVVDRLSTQLFTTDKCATENLVKEGLKDRTFFSGDVMYDAFLHYSAEVHNRGFLMDLPEKFVLMTWHRAENTSDKERMEYLLDVILQIPETVVCPMHPRTQNQLKAVGLWDKALSISNFHMIDPVGYLEMIEMTNRAKWILTDSGGLSKESFFAGKRCVFMVDLEIWPELMEDRWIIPLKENMKETIEEIEDSSIMLSRKDSLFGDGHAAERIVEHVTVAGKG